MVNFDINFNDSKTQSYILIGAVALIVLVFLIWLFWGGINQIPCHNNNSLSASHYDVPYVASRINKSVSNNSYEEARPSDISISLPSNDDDTYYMEEHAPVAPLRHNVDNTYYMEEHTPVTHQYPVAPLAKKTQYGPGINNPRQNNRIESHQTYQHDIRQQVFSSKKNERKRSKGELECQRVMEELYNAPFPTVSPDWLINPKTGYRMELDCYNEKHNIAVEYQGRQHYEFVKAFHRTEDDLQKQKERDLLKFQLCIDKGVYLITVPFTVKLEDIRDYIIYYLPHNRARRLMQGTTK